MIHFRPPYTQESVKEQFRELSKRYHPDKPGGSLEKMREVNLEHEFILQLLDKGLTAVEMKPHLGSKKKLSTKSAAYRRIKATGKGRANKLMNGMIIRVVNIDAEKVYPILK